MPDVPAKEHKPCKPAVRGPSLGAYIEQAEATGKCVASLSVNVTLTFDQPEVNNNTQMTPEQLRRLI